MTTQEIINEFKDWLKRQFGDNAGVLTLPPLRIHADMDDVLEITCDHPLKIVRRNNEEWYITVIYYGNEYRMKLTNPEVASFILRKLETKGSLKGVKMRIKTERVGEALRVEVGEA